MFGPASLTAMAAAKGLSALPEYVVGLAIVVFFVSSVLLYYGAKKRQEKELE